MLFPHTTVPVQHAWHRKPVNRQGCNATRGFTFRSSLPRACRACATGTHFALPVSGFTGNRLEATERRLAGQILSTEEGGEPCSASCRSEKRERVSAGSLLSISSAGNSL